MATRIIRIQDSLPNETKIKEDVVLEKKDYILSFLLFLSFFFIGADRIGFHVLGVNIRIDQILWVITTLWILVFNKYTFIKNVPLFGFILFSFISTLFSISVTRSSFYFLSILFNYLFIANTVYSYSKCVSANHLIKVIRTTFLCYGILILLTAALKLFLNIDIPYLETYGIMFGIPRIRLFFYEPSYLATMLIFWVAFCAFLVFVGKKKEYLLDLILSIISCFLTTSSTGMAGTIVVFLLVFLFGMIGRQIKMKALFQCLILVCLPILAFYLYSPTGYAFFFKRIFSSDLNGATGGRVSAYPETIHVFLENKLFGCGMGCYGLYLNQGFDYVPTNVTLELLATLGIIPSALFLILNLNPVAILFREMHNKEEFGEDRLLFLAGCFALFSFFLILQVNQGFLRLYHWFFLGLLFALQDNMKSKEQLKIFEKYVFPEEILE